MAAPKHLKPATRKWFDSVLESYELEPHHLRLLTLAAQAWDEAELARKALEEHGYTYEDRFGAPRSRPEVAIQRDARLGLVRVLRELALDINEPPAGSRPPPIRR